MECYSLKQYVNCVSPRRKNTPPVWIDTFAPSSNKHCIVRSSIFSFLDELSSSYFTRQIFLPSRITGSTKTLIDNIFCNIPQSSEQNFSANLTAHSNHLPQELLGFTGIKMYINQTCSFTTGKTLIMLHFLLIINLQTVLLLYKLIKGIIIFLFTITLKKLKRWYQITLF